MTVATATYKNLIDGEWVDASDGATFEVTDPANGELLGVFPDATRDIDLTDLKPLIGEEE